MKSRSPRLKKKSGGEETMKCDLVPQSLEGAQSRQDVRHHDGTEEVLDGVLDGGRCARQSPVFEQLFQRSADDFDVP